MIRRSYTPKDADNCEDDFVVAGLGLADIGLKRGVPLPTLKKWSSKRGWQRKRKEFKEVTGGTQARLVGLLNTMLAKAEGSEDAQDIYAVLKIQNLLTEKPDKRKLTLEILTSLTQFLMNSGREKLAEELGEVFSQFADEIIG